MIVLVAEVNFSDLGAFREICTLNLDQRAADGMRLRQALRARGTRPCIPGRSGRCKPIRHGKQLYRQRHKVEIMFGRLKDWRRIHTRYGCRAHTFIGAVTLAAIVLFWLPPNEY